MNSCHFSVCCSRYQSLFKKSRLSWNCEVLAENELSAWDPCGISPALVPMSVQLRQNQGSCLVDHISAGESPICTNLIPKTLSDSQLSNEPLDISIGHPNPKLQLYVTSVVLPCKSAQSFCGSDSESEGHGFYYLFNHSNQSIIL